MPRFWDVNSNSNCGRMAMMTGLIHAMVGAETGIAAVAEPETETRTHPAEGDPANDWLCVSCLNPVASEKDRFLHEGDGEFSFKNPEGIRFNILLFSRTLGCMEIGTPTLEHTWFPGHAWSFCVCDRCNSHLGWFYNGPSAFTGLICERIFRASLSGN